MMNLQEMKVKELRELAGEKEVTGRWDMNKQQLIDALTPILEAEQAAQAEQQNEEKPSRKGRTRTINVFKDGQLVETVEGLIETFKWAEQNNVCNQGWVKHSLKTGKETVAGRKFKESGYRFEYAG